MNDSRATSGMISSFQLGAVVASSIVGIGVLTLPRLAARAVESGAPLLVFAGMTCGMLFLAALAYLMSRHPGQSLFRFSEQLIGKGAARVLNGLLILYFLFVSGMTARQFGEAVVQVLLQKTPIEIVVSFLILLAGLSCRRDRLKFVFVHQFYLPFILLPGIVVVAVSMQNAEMANLLPVLGNRSFDWGGELIQIAAASQIAFVIVLLGPILRRPRRAVAATALGAVLVTLLYTAIVVATIAVFGAEEVKLLTYPTLETARSASLGSGQRLDALFLIVWVISIFTSVYSTYYFCAYGTRELLGLRDQRMIATFGMPFVYAAALLPANIFELYRWSERLNLYGAILFAGYPALLLLLSLIRRSGRRTEEAEGHA
ncbi:endospore germination permease [Paenibacillus albicereus]|uniref:Endospore germination permease n=1 Tax=Paenibacillus albicereus TaxID=2726185 RepID=A0A6H2H1N2_9BACL|nr:endospore germination permease [Paenibacillus albicereus]QJC53509.1 endospore germination permease [Paenibacillus albicereus]